METIKTSLSTLRQTTDQVQCFIREKTGWPGSLDLQMAIEDDLGLAGLDTESLLIEFSQEFSVDLSQFDFTGSITYDGLSAKMWLMLVLLLLYLPFLLAAWVTRVLIAAACSLFSRQKATYFLSLKIGVPAFIKPEHTPHNVLRIGDMVASAALGRFVKREAVRFELISPTTI